MTAHKPLIFDQRWCGQHGIGRFASELHAGLPEFSGVILPTKPLSATDPLKLARYLRSVDAEAYFTPGFNVPLSSPCPVIATVHDLIHLHCRDERSLAKSLYYRWLQRPVLRASPVVLTVSQFSKQEIVEWYGVDPSRVQVVGNGVSEDFHPHGPTSDEQAPYFLYVGNVRAHKNLSALLQAFARVAESITANLCLVCRADDRLREQLAELGISQRTRLLTNLSDSQLATWYRGALATVQPSLYEGFGLPVVEAMACGCPVLAANRTSLPEVCGDAALLFDPDNIDELAQLLLATARDQIDRVNFVSRGVARAADYQWPNVVARVRAALGPYCGGQLASVLAEVA